jgi:hypothetical protein
VDNTECGIVKFFKAHDALNWFATSAWVISDHRGIGSVWYAHNPGQRGPRCDFRFKAGGPFKWNGTPDFFEIKEC